MIIAAALAIALSGHANRFHRHPPVQRPPRVQVVKRHFTVAGWSLRTYRDTFTGTLSCSLATKTMRFRRDALIFASAPLATPPTPMFESTARRPGRSPKGSARSRRGVLPRRGWIDDPAGGDVALPVSWLKGAKQVDIRASWATRPRRFDVSRLAEALAAARRGRMLGPRALRPSRGPRARLTIHQGSRYGFFTLWRVRLGARIAAWPRTDDVLISCTH